MYFDTTYYQKARVSRLTRGIAGVISGQFSNVSQYMNLRRSNIELTLENVALRNEVEKLKGTLEEKGTVTLVDSLHGAKYLYIPARVIHNSVNRQQNYITLNVGQNDGVTQGMGVICGNGVIGVVASVSKNFSTAISLLNINLKVSAKLQKSGIFGSLSWDGLNYREVVLKDIPLHVPVAVGDSVVTSGFSSIFPRDIPMGTVVNFYVKDGSFYTIHLQLLADFKRLDHVYVVKSFDQPEISQIETTNSND